MAMDKKKRAALAAVVQYLQAEQQAAPVEEAHTAAVESEAAIPDRSMLSVVRPWGLNGRIAQMQTRTLMQLRTFRS